MKAFYWIVLVMFGINSLYGQTSNVNTENSDTKELTFVIISKANVSNPEAYVAALQNANMDKYRLVNARRVIRFDTGFEVELLSVTELDDKGIPYDENRISLDEPPKGYNPVFKLGENGYILEFQTVRSKK